MAMQRFEQISAQDNTRLHLGNSYNYSTHNHHHNGVWRDEASNQGTAEEMTLSKALEFPQMSRRHDTIATASSQSCQWLCETPQYTRWRDDRLHYKHRGCLWLKGKPGAGKSTIMKALLKDAIKENTERKIVSFFFNARGNPLERSIEGMYRALVYQMAKDVPQLKEMVSFTALKDYANNGWPLELLKDMCRVAVENISRERRLSCFIDALDEGDVEDDVRDMVYHLTEIASMFSVESSGVSVCFASRHYPKISLDLCEELILEKQDGHQKSITRYVTANLKLRNPTLEEQLAPEIHRKSAGVFLWVVLVIRMLNKEADRGSHYRLWQILKATPTLVNDLIKEIVNKDRDERLLPAVQWLLYFGHALTAEQLYYAIVISIGQPGVQLDTRGEGLLMRPALEDFILSSTKGLAEVVVTGHSDVHSSPVQFIHETVREYFFNHGLKELDPALAGCEDVASVCHRRLAEWCRDYVHIAWQQHLRSELQFNAAAGIGKHKWSEAKLRLPFLSRALDGMLQHAELAGEHEIAGVTFGNFILMTLWSFDKRMETLGYREESALEPEPESSLSILHVLADKGHVSLFTRQLQICCRDLEQNMQQSLVNARAGGLGSALHLAAAKGHDVIARTLIANGADIDANVIHLGTPLYVAVSNNQEHVVEMLLQHGADVNAAQERSKTPLYAALKNESLSIITALLRHGAGRGKNHEDDGSALRLAAQDRRSAIVEGLLNLGLDVNAHSGDGCTALHAVFNIDDDDKSVYLIDVKSTLRSLLLHGGDVNARCSKHGTALHMVLSSERFSITAVTLLLEHGANVNLSCGRLGTPVNVAIMQCQALNYSRRRSELLADLLACSIDLSSPIGEYGNVVETAAKMNDYEAMSTLMKHGVNVQADDFSETGPYDNPDVAMRNMFSRRFITRSSQTQSSLRHIRSGRSRFDEEWPWYAKPIKTTQWR